VTISPFLIVGCPRSGSTLLASMLNRHPEISVVRNTDVMWLPLRRVVRHGHRAMVDAYIRSQREPDLLLDRERLLGHFGSKKCDPGHLLRALMEAQGELQGATVVGESTPDHLHHVPDILEAMPDARVLCIERDGRDVALSLVRAESTHDWLRIHCHRWLAAIADQCSFAELYPDRFRIVRFDELVGSPARTMADIGKFLGVDWSGMAARTSIRTALIPEPEAAWKTQALSEPDASRAEAWRHDATPRQVEVMQGILGDELQRFDYAIYADLPPAALSDRVLSVAARVLYTAAYRSARQRPPKAAQGNVQGRARTPGTERNTVS